MIYNILVFVKSSTQRHELAMEKTYIDSLENTPEEARIYDPLLRKPRNADNIPPQKMQYRDLTADSVLAFWEGIWNMQIAYSLYHWAKDVVLIEHNYNDPNIGDLMKTTFINMAHSAWVNVLGPRRENRVAAHLPIPHLRKGSYGVGG